MTITSKTGDWIFILHAGGMGNVKIADLSKETQIQLGYAKPEKPKSTQELTPGMQALAELNLPPMAEVQEAWQAEGPAAAITLLSNTNLLATAKTLWPVLSLVAVIYLFFCYCCQMICRKTHTSPGFLIWVPVLQLIPLLRAAGMSRMWLFAFFVPLLNLVAQIIWYVKIVQARGKGPLLVLWLVLPFTGPFAFLYLAFSSAAPVEIEREGPLVLETA
ncbi:MAG: hypothetical protein KIS67_01130 [Verrucomicrobiae bacterium]|nr:hypothetical protein [Verrucomicrobiae bacterium]